jgi:hypothetical protein
MANSALDLEELREWLRESAREFDRRSQEINERFDKQSQEFNERFDKQSQEFNERFDKQSQEFSERFDKISQEIERLSNLYTTQWGRLMEALIEPGSVELFRARGVDVKTVAPRVKSQRNGRNFEVDLLLEDETQIIVVEVKTTLTVDDVREFLNALDSFLDFFPRYEGYTIYGAVAGVHVAEQADRFAYKSGLFVLGLGTEGLTRIENDEKFKPLDFRRALDNGET